ncbi:hypothetical protein ASD64_19935 [Mesorhizobium sp. Root157]|uniref:hypothetical protein n=1 Tax=Mesorhizobium sp. Root157 TaxID=1736477 RepID=UPI0006FE80D5|nr:hypothetical protein [Mesorhizobium sp. Root157]KQZ87857.1 hypothetical protein ASD64_19935 [Mesorhizobium sp. Root157]
MTDPGGMLLFQFEGLGTSEYYALRLGGPFFLPTEISMDGDNLHVRDGISALQSLVSDFLKAAPAAPSRKW